MSISPNRSAPPAYTRAGSCGDGKSNLFHAPEAAACSSHATTSTSAPSQENILLVDKIISIIGKLNIFKEKKSSEAKFSGRKSLQEVFNDVSYDDQDRILTELLKPVYVLTGEEREQIFIYALEIGALSALSKFEDSELKDLFPNVPKKEELFAMLRHPVNCLRAINPFNARETAKRDITYFAFLLKTFDITVKDNARKIEILTRVCMHRGIPLRINKFGKADISSIFKSNDVAFTEHAKKLAAHYLEKHQRVRIETLREQQLKNIILSGEINTHFNPVIEGDINKLSGIIHRLFLKINPPAIMLDALTFLDKVGVGTFDNEVSDNHDIHPVQCNGLKQMLENISGGKLTNYMDDGKHEIISTRNIFERLTRSTTAASGKLDISFKDNRFLLSFPGSSPDMKEISESDYMTLTQIGTYENLRAICATVECSCPAGEGVVVSIENQHFFGVTGAESKRVIMIYSLADPSPFESTGKSIFPFVPVETTGGQLRLLQRNRSFQQPNVRSIPRISSNGLKKFRQIALRHQGQGVLVAHALRFVDSSKNQGFGRSEYAVSSAEPLIPKSINNDIKPFEQLATFLDELHQAGIAHGGVAMSHLAMSNSGNVVVYVVASTPDKREKNWQAFHVVEVSNDDNGRTTTFDDAISTVGETKPHVVALIESNISEIKVVPDTFVPPKNDMISRFNFPKRQDLLKKYKELKMDDLIQEAMQAQMKIAVLKDIHLFLFAVIKSYYGSVNEQTIDSFCTRFVNGAKNGKFVSDILNNPSVIIEKYVPSVSVNANPLIAGANGSDEEHALSVAEVVSTKTLSQGGDDDDTNLPLTPISSVADSSIDPLDNGAAQNAPKLPNNLPCLRELLVWSGVNTQSS